MKQEVRDAARRENLRVCDIGNPLACHIEVNSEVDLIEAIGRGCVEGVRSGGNEVVIDDAAQHGERSPEVSLRERVHRTRMVRRRLTATGSLTPRLRSVGGIPHKPHTERGLVALMSALNQAVTGEPVFLRPDKPHEAVARTGSRTSTSRPAAAADVQLDDRAVGPLTKRREASHGEVSGNTPR